MHSLHQGGDVFQFGIRRHAVAQIENMAAGAAHLGQYPAGFRRDDFRVRQEQSWIKIALHANLFRQLGAHLRQPDRPVDSQHVGAGVHQRLPVAVDILGKHDDRHGVVQRGHDLFDPVGRRGRKCVPGQQPTEAVEDLHGIHPRLDLHLQQARDGGGQLFHQPRKEFRLGIK